VSPNGEQAGGGTASPPGGAPLREAIEPLPRGRHNLSRDDVRESQRARLIRAMLDCVAEQGYPATTVADVVAAARCSRNAFYELFEDKEACYIAACDETATEMLEALYSAVEEESWLAALRRGMDSYLRWWAEHPRFAAAYVIDLPTAGRRALEQRDRAYARFAEMFEGLAARARAEQPSLAPLGPLAVRLLVTGITEVVAQEVRQGRLAELLELEDELVELVALTLTAGAENGSR
jgi:AcrR family transcriptional regulator